MELKIRNGDYIADGIGGERRADGAEALLERALFRLSVRSNTVKIRKVKGENFGFLPLQHLFNFSCIEFVFYILCKL